MKDDQLLSFIAGMFAIFTAIAFEAPQVVAALGVLSLAAALSSIAEAIAGKK